MRDAPDSRLRAHHRVQHVRASLRLPGPPLYDDADDVLDRHQPEHGDELPFGGAYPLFENVQHDITFDRCIFHPYESDPLLWRSCTRAFALDGINMTVKNCYIYDFMGWQPQVPTGVTVTAATKANPLSPTLGGPWIPDGYQVSDYLQRRDR